ncbi:MAG: site-specific DNA-methyltransferase [Bacteroidaceae bacterium]|nr:site-specific DNA-methyltransferase [Bacteroidaceae bacterium]
METYREHITMSPDMNAERLETLRQLFPDWFTQEGRLDINEVKKAVNPDDVDETERYEFRWFGKSKAKRNAFTPTRATLHYDAERSVNADKTENVIIEGENLEVLKILSSSYRGKIKFIYIDPPYNTGEDFLYNDNFSENKTNYWERSESVENGIRLDTNSDSSGRFHSNWLDDMYGRLLVARTLLKPDGVIFISMDDHEIHHLRKICDEIFGEDNFLVNIIWEKRYTRSNNSKLFGTMTEHVLCYRRSTDLENIKEPRNERSDEIYTNPDNDPRGSWTSVSYVNPASREERPNLCYIINNPITGKNVEHPTNAWKYEYTTYLQHVSENKLYWGQDGNNTYPRLKKFLSEMEGGMVPSNFWKREDVGTTDQASAELEDLIGRGIFPFPKPVQLVQKAISFFINGNDDKDCIVLDFFAGSGTTGHAVVNQNLLDGGHRKYILVQIPQLTSTDSNAYRAGFKTISEVTIARNKAVHDKIKASYEGRLITPEDQQQLDQLGFKVFTLSKSSFPRVDFAPNPEKSEEENLELFHKYLEEKEQQMTLAFNEDELITEILITRGFQLTYNLEKQESFTQNTVYLATDGIKTAYICVDSQLYNETVNYFMEHADTKFICIERALDTTKKFNLKKKMGDKFFAF